MRATVPVIVVDVCLHRAGRRCSADRRTVEGSCRGRAERDYRGDRGEDHEERAHHGSTVCALTRVVYVGGSGRLHYMDSERSNRHGMLLCAAAAVCFGAATPFSRRLLSSTDSVTLAGLLYIGAALAAGPIAVRQRSESPRRVDWTHLGLAVIVGGGVAPVLLLVGLDRVPSPTVSILLNLELVATVAIAWAAFGERVDRDTLIGIGLVLAAGVWLAWGRGNTIGPAALLVVGACIGWGVDNAITANLTAFTPAQITTAKGVVAGTVNLLIGLTLFGGATTEMHTVVAALALGAVGYGASIMLWIAGARSIGAARGQAIFATAPFIGVVLAWPIVGERVNQKSTVALVLAALGVTIVSRQHLPPRHQHHAVTHTHTHRHDDLHHTHEHHDAITTAGPHRHTHTHSASTHQHLGRHIFRHR